MIMKLINPHCAIRMAILMAISSLAVIASAEKSCIAPVDTYKYLNKDVCVSAHIYDVIEFKGKYSFLDVCSPDTTDEQCPFTIVSLAADRKEVGNLSQYRGKDVRIRGIVQTMHGRTGILLSHARQFNGKPAKFHPNPKLLNGFSAAENDPPINDPNLRSQGGRRAFMNTRDKTTLSGK
jgi:hypothetical protein